MRTRRNKNTKKQNQAESRIFGIIAISIILFIAFGIGQIRQNSRNEYALRNNCKWYATGSFYGDDRDFICK